ncbi:hypothetical protein J4N45_10095 [Vibrio sp. SCSIO 43140]|uniref:hypothetical protein n=1 Tax=Vibrio sp. SCSIO 43140 TaxID=2819100 RepID=UPI002075FB38|nr:hypothetical protein [Vibrio sp. SCSIO 43140]USD58880.1 hypothetical protein J4N45_10095 [Vibrio sp. SCSIO 43140]
MKPRSEKQHQVDTQSEYVSKEGKKYNMFIDIDTPPTEQSIKMQRRKLRVNSFVHLLILVIGMVIIAFPAILIDIIAIKVVFVFGAIVWGFALNHIAFDYLEKHTTLLPSVSFLDVEFHHTGDLKPVSTKYSYFNKLLEHAPELRNYVLRVITMDRKFYRFEVEAFAVFTSKKAEDEEKAKLQRLLNNRSI